jgi:DNA-binding transcriptional LysR family regulator
MQAMDWSDLQSFLAIARSGQLGKAGQVLGVNATTVGRRLRRLETKLGQTLFEQTREGQVLTEAGEALLVRVETMANAATGIDETSRRSSELQVSGTLRISVSEGFGSWFLAPRLDQLVSAHPDLTVDLVANSGFLSLSKRETDIAVMLSRPKAGPVVARKLSDYALGLFASARYLEEKGTPQSIGELAKGHCLVGYIPDLLYDPELRYLDELGAGLSPKLRSSSIIAQLQLVASGAGIGVLPCFMAAGEARLVPILEGHRIKRAFWLVTHKDTQQLARVKVGKEWILDCVGKNRSLLDPYR